MNMYKLEFCYVSGTNKPLIKSSEFKVVSYRYKRKVSKYNKNKYVYYLSNGAYVIENNLDKIGAYNTYTLDKTKIKEYSKDMLNMRIEQLNRSLVENKLNIEAHKKAMLEI